MLEEDKIIASLYPGNHYPDDDCALLHSGDLITTDTIVENTHFRMEWSSPQDVAIKLFESNLSDIVSSGGKPEWCLLNLGISPGLNERDISAFVATFKGLLDLHGVRLIGGDTFSSNEFHATLTLAGPVVRHLPRNTGKPGDSLYLTGIVGLSLLGYMFLSRKFSGEKIEISSETWRGFNGGSSRQSTFSNLQELAMERHLRPRARVEESRFLVEESRVHAAMDLSDGIFPDAGRLAHSSSLHLDIHLEKIPVPMEAASVISPTALLESGEEYELLFLAEPGLQFHFPCYEIGHASEGSGCDFYLNGKIFKMEGHGFDHFGINIYGQKK